MALLFTAFGLSLFFLCALRPETMDRLCLQSSALAVTRLRLFFRAQRRTNRTFCFAQE
jgi:hypothetical protein